MRNGLPQAVGGYDAQSLRCSGHGRRVIIFPEQYTLRQSRQIHLQHSPCTYGAAPDFQQRRGAWQSGWRGQSITIHVQCLFSSDLVVVISDGHAFGRGPSSYTAFGGRKRPLKGLSMAISLSINETECLLIWQTRPWGRPGAAR